MTRTCPRPHRATVKPLEDIATQLPHLASLSPSSTPMPSPWNTSPYVFALGTCLGSPEEWLDLRVRRLTLAQVVSPLLEGLWEIPKCRLCRGFPLPAPVSRSLWSAGRGTLWSGNPLGKKLALSLYSVSPNLTPSGSSDGVQLTAPALSPSGRSSRVNSWGIVPQADVVISRAVQDDRSIEPQADIVVSQDDIHSNKSNEAERACIRPHPLPTCLLNLRTAGDGSTICLAPSTYPFAQAYLSSHSRSQDPLNR